MTTTTISPTYTVQVNHPPLPRRWPKKWEVRRNVDAWHSTRLAIFDTYQQAADLAARLNTAEG